MAENRGLKRAIFWGLAALAVIVSIAVILMRSKPASTNEKHHNQSSRRTRIVSLIPSVTQSIYDMGGQEHLVGRSNYCLSVESDSIPIVGTVTKPDIEKIAMLRPDIVFVSGMIPPKEIATIEKFGIAIEKIESPKSFEQICHQYERIGELIGRRQQAEEVTLAARHVVDSIRAKNSNIDSAKPKIFMQVAASPIYSVIPNTFMDDYITLAGCRNIGEELTNGAIGREYIIARNPDHIFIVTMGIVGQTESDEWRKFRNITAVIQNNIHILNSDIACQPTPATFIQTLQEIDQTIATKNNE